MGNEILPSKYLLSFLHYRPHLMTPEVVPNHFNETPVKFGKPAKTASCVMQKTVSLCFLERDTLLEDGNIMIAGIF